MAYLELEELYTHIYEENVLTISRGDDAVPLSAIDAAMAEARGYLDRFDVQKIFDARGNQRNALLLVFVKDIAAWHFVNLCNAGVDLDLREKRYDRAVQWLKEVQRGNVNPYFPPKTQNDTACCQPVIGPIVFGSNPKRDNHF